MKRLVIAFAALAALSATGVSLAQGSEQVFPPDPVPHGASTFGGPVYVSPRVMAERQQAREEFRLACEADRESLCSKEARGATLRCINYHRLRVSTPCKQALTDLRRAQTG